MGPLNHHSGLHAFSNPFSSRDSSPHGSSVKPDTISSFKQIEEETLPKYNPNSFYPARYDEVLNDRYKIVAKLGYGVTATVWLAKDSHASPRKGGKRYVAIKININTISDGFVTSRRKIAERLQSTNPQHPGYNHIRFMLETFEVKGPHGKHLCVVYDVLREPIGICMEKFPNHLFNADKLRILLPALLQGLDYLHSECRVVHTDLKPDNVMMGLGEPAVLDRFVENQRSHPTPRKTADHGRIIYQSCTDFGEQPSELIIATTKITDIGLAEWGDEHHNNPIQSNAFTAPEVILTAGWSYPADIWNLGVMLWDLFENFGLFDSINTKPGFYHADQHLGLMIALMGPPPKALLERGSTTATYFDEHGNFRKLNLIKKDFSFEQSITRVRGPEKDVFIDFVKHMICWLPEDRWTAKQLLDHPWLKMESSLSRRSTYGDETKDRGGIDRILSRDNDGYRVSQLTTTSSASHATNSTEDTHVTKILDEEDRKVSSQDLIQAILDRK